MSPQHPLHVGHRTPLRPPLPPPSSPPINMTTSSGSQISFNIVLLFRFTLPTCVETSVRDLRRDNRHPDLIILNHIYLHPTLHYHSHHAQHCFQFDASGHTLRASLLLYTHTLPRSGVHCVSGVDLIVMLKTFMSCTGPTPTANSVKPFFYIIYIINSEFKNLKSSKKNELSNSDDRQRSPDKSAPFRANRLEPGIQGPGQSSRDPVGFFFLAGVRWLSRQTPSPVASATGKMCSHARYQQIRYAETNTIRP